MVLNFMNCFAGCCTKRCVCLQLFDNEESFIVAVFKAEENQISLLHKFPCPKVVTNRIIRVSRNLHLQ